VSVKCSLSVRMFETGANAVRSAILDRATEDRGFGPDENAAATACFARVAKETARVVVAAMRAPVVSAPFVTLQLDIVDPGAIQTVLQGLKRLGMVTATEVRHVAAKVAEIRVFTRSGGLALQQSLVREVGAKLSVTPTQSTNDVLAWRVRATESAPSEENP
jgi:hypothetical protein